MSDQKTFLQDTSVGDTVSIDVCVDGPFGVKFVPDVQGNAAVIMCWERLPNGKYGELQLHGGLHLGDVLISVNDDQLHLFPFEQSMAIINDTNMLRKAFQFISSQEYYRRRSLSTMTQPTSTKNRFLSIIKQSRVISDYAEYEIICQISLVGIGVGSVNIESNDTIIKWSVWKRYSEFKALFLAMKASLGWRLQSIELPSEHVFVLFKLTPEFLDYRRDELNIFWQKLLATDKVTDFDKHHCSRELKEFLNVEDELCKHKLQCEHIAYGNDENRSDISNKNVNNNNREDSVNNDGTSAASPPIALPSKQQARIQMKGEISSLHSSTSSLNNIGSSGNSISNSAISSGNIIAGSGVTKRRPIITTLSS